MRPLARSSLPFFDSATPSPSLPSSSAAPTPPRTPLTLAPPSAHVDSATVVVPAVEGRPVSLSASVLLHGGSGDSARAVGAGSLETGEVLLEAGQGDESAGAPHEGGHTEGSDACVERGVAEERRRHQRFSTYTTKCLDELRSADDGTLTAWTAGLDATLSPPSSTSPEPPSEARLAPSSPHVPPSNSSTSLSSFIHLEPPSLARTPHSSTSTAATTTSRSSCPPSIFSPSRWRRPKAPDSARTSSSPAPPTPPRPRPPPRASSPARTSSPATSSAAATARAPARVVRFAPSSPRSTSPSRSSHRHAPSPPPPDPGWHVVAASRLRSDPNAQGQGHGALPPREPGAWARWTAPRPVVRAWERGDEGLRATARAEPRSSAGGRSARGRSNGGELSWGERVGLELDRAARAAAAAAVDEAEESPG